MNEVEISNVALSRVGAGSIQALTDSTREARTANLYYIPSRDTVLADIEPNFAEVQATLSELSETVTGYTYVYLYPVDCISALEIYNSAKVHDEDKIDFKVRISSTGNYRVILTEEAEAELIYIKRVENTTVFDALFCDSLAWKMAADMAMPLRSDDKIATYCARAYAASVALAKVRAKSEGHQTPNESSSFERAR